MAKFRRKPGKVVEPIQFTGSNYDEIVAFTKGNAVHHKTIGGDQGGNGHPQMYEKITIETIHQGQVVELTAGDWVMPESDGVHFYPVKPDVFADTYEPV